MNAYPTFAPVRVDMPIDLRGWAVFAGRANQTNATGLLFEGRPGVADYVIIWSTGIEVHLQPHYTFSTWDEFWADPIARIRATGFGGLFPFTLGPQKSLRDGVLSILDRAATELDRRAERATAADVRACATHIRAMVAAGVAPPDGKTS